MARVQNDTLRSVQSGQVRLCRVRPRSRTGRVVDFIRIAIFHSAFWLGLIRQTFSYSVGRKVDSHAYVRVSIILAQTHGHSTFGSCSTFSGALISLAVRVSSPGNDLPCGASAPHECDNPLVSVFIAENDTPHLKQNHWFPRTVSNCLLLRIPYD